MISIDEATSIVNAMAFPVTQEGDTVVVENYEFLFESETWVYNQKYIDPENPMDGFVDGIPPSSDDDE